MNPKPRLGKRRQPYWVSRAGSGLFVASCRICPHTESGFDFSYNARMVIRRHVEREHYALAAVAGHCISIDGDMWHEIKSCNHGGGKYCCYLEYKSGDDAAKYVDFVNGGVSR